MSSGRHNQPLKVRKAGRRSKGGQAIGLQEHIAARFKNAIACRKHLNDLLAESRARDPESPTVTTLEPRMQV